LYKENKNNNILQVFVTLSYCVPATCSNSNKTKYIKNISNLQNKIFEELKSEEVSMFAKSNSKRVQAYNVWCVESIENRCLQTC